MTVPRRSARLSFVAKWAVATSVGLTVGLAAGFVASLFDSLLAGAAVAGAAVGACQSLLLDAGVRLRWTLSTAAVWVLGAAVVGALASSIFGFLLFTPALGRLVEWYGGVRVVLAACAGLGAVGAATGLLGGFLQWAVCLRRAEGRWWVLGSALGWGVPCALAVPVVVVARWGESPAWTGAVPLLGLLMGAIGGVTLVPAVRAGEGGEGGEGGE